MACPPSGLVHLCNYSGTLTGGATNLAVLGVSAYTATFDDTVAGALRVMFSGSAPLALTWVGDALSNYWDTGSALVWTNAMAVRCCRSPIQPGAVRRHHDLPEPDRHRDGVAGLGPVHNDYALYDLSGPGKITGSTALTKKGYGPLGMKVTNDYVGGTVISAGDVTIGNNTALGTGPITLGDADTALAGISLLANYGNWSQATKIANAITVSTNGSGTVAIGSTAFNPGTAYATIYTGPVVLNRATTLRSGNTDRTTFEGQISGTVGTLTIDGSARVTMGSPAFTNTFVGDVSIVGANTVFQFGHGANTYGDVIPDSSVVNVDAGAFFRINQGAETIKNLQGSGQLGFAGQNGVVTLALGSGTFPGTITPPPWPRMGRTPSPWPVPRTTPPAAPR